MKNILKYLLFTILGIGGVAGAYYGYKKIMFQHEVLALNVVPANAIYIVECKKPVSAWNEVRKSNLWSNLRQNPFFSDIDKKATLLDSLIDDNPKLSDLLGNQYLTISAHPISVKDYDFLYLVDLEKSKAGWLQEILKPLLSQMNQNITVQEHKGVEIIKIYDPQKREALFISTLDNLAMASYTSKLIYQAIEQADQHTLETNAQLSAVRKQVSNSGMFNIYMQFAFLDDYMRMYSDNPADLENYKTLSQLLTFGGWETNLKGDFLQFKGLTMLNDSATSLVHALQKCTPGKRRAAQIAPDRTAMYLSFQFDKFTDVYDKYLQNLAKNEAEYNSATKTQKRIENWLKIDLRNDFIDWISGEVALLTINFNTETSKSEGDKIMILHTEDLEKAKTGLEKIMRQVKKRSPLRFKNRNYKEYTIYSLEIKGFFKLVFGKMFEKFEKPYFTYIEDYVVLSNNIESLEAFIEAYDAGNTLQSKEEFEDFNKKFDTKSHVFAYLNMENSFPLVPAYVNSSTAKSINANEKYFISARQIGFHLVGNEKGFESEFRLQYVPHKNNTNLSAPEDIPTTAIREHLSLEDSLSKIEHPDGPFEERFRNEKPKIRANYKDGKLDGDFRVFYKNGNTETQGRYRKGKKVDVWYYYNRKGKMIRKEVYNENSELVQVREM